MTYGPPDPAFLTTIWQALLSLSFSVQLAAFFMVASLGVLTDQLVLGPLRDLALDKTQTIAIHVVTYVVCISLWFN